jgi:hypothetical protein
MADDQLAGTGQKAQLWISTDGTTANLTRLRGVVGFDIPSLDRDWEDVSDLDSDAHEYAPKLPDVAEMKVTLNFRPGSDTDELLDDAAEDGNPRAIRMIVPIRGVLTKKYDFLGYATYKPGSAEVDSKMESELGIRTTGGITKTAYP